MSEATSETPHGEPEMLRPVFVNVQFLPKEAEQLRTLDALCAKQSLNRATLAKQIMLKYLTGRLLEPDGVQSNAESVTVTKLRNQLQNTISRHDREAESLKAQIAQLKREKQQIISRTNELNGLDGGHSGLGLSGLSQKGLSGMIESKVSERVREYERERKLEDLTAQLADRNARIAALEREVDKLETENDGLSDELAEAERKMNSDAEIEKKLERYTAPVLSGVAKAFPALKDRIEGLVAGGLGELPGGADGYRMGLSQDDRDGLDFARDLRRKFSGEEQDMIVELIGHFHADKRLLKHNLHATQSIAKQQEESTDDGNG